MKQNLMEITSESFIKMRLFDKYMRICHIHTYSTNQEVEKDAKKSDLKFLNMVIK